MTKISNLVHYEDIPKYKKGWGYEKWIVNTEKYCGKQLVLGKGKKCSIHYHKLKTETFFVIEGSLMLELYSKPFEVIESDLEASIKAAGDIKVQRITMRTYDSLTIEPYTPHRFIGLSENPTVFLEFSTQHFEDDSYRIHPGDSQK